MCGDAKATPFLQMREVGGVAFWKSLRVSTYCLQSLTIAIRTFQIPSALAGETPSHWHPSLIVITDATILIFK
jgi:hypothetical protein